MGCDIHYVLERKIGHRWLGLQSHHGRNNLASQRNYMVFAELASVRGESSKGRYPQFLPSDTSELAMHWVGHDGSDGHSHSHLPLKEFCECYEDVKNSPEPWEKLFGIYIETEKDGSVDDYRVIFWFDN